MKVGQRLAKRTRGRAKPMFSVQCCGVYAQVSFRAVESPQHAAQARGRSPEGAGPAGERCVHAPAHRSPVGVRIWQLIITSRSAGEMEFLKLVALLEFRGGWKVV